MNRYEYQKQKRERQLTQRLIDSAIKSGVRPNIAKKVLGRTVNDNRKQLGLNKKKPVKKGNFRVDNSHKKGLRNYSGLSSNQPLVLTPHNFKQILGLVGNGTNEGKEALAPPVIVKDERQVKKNDVKVEVSQIGVIAQRRKVEIFSDIDVNAFRALCWTWPLYALHNFVGANETLAVPGLGTIGKLHFMSAAIGYDLWLAINGGFSIFSRVPEAYLDLRGAIMPTEKNGFKYQFNSSARFLGAGGMYASWALEEDGASLSFISSESGDLYPLSTTVPAYTDEILAEYGPDVVFSIWTQLVGDEKVHQWVSGTAIGPFDNSVAVFAETKITGEDPYNIQWATFSHELRQPHGDKWLSFLGLCVQTPNAYRAGGFTDTDYQGSHHYNYRVAKGIKGKTGKDTRIRFKQISIEEIMSGITSSVVAGDIQYNAEAGATSLNNSTFPKSVVKTINAGYFLRGALTAVIKRYWAQNWIGYDQTQGRQIAIAGAKWVTSAVNMNDRLPTWMVEGFSGLQMLTVDPPKSSMTWVTIPVLVCGGTFVSQGFSDEMNQINLAPLVEIAYPEITVNSYQFAANGTGVPDYIDPLDFSQSETEGASAPEFTQAFQTTLGILQGNMDTSVASNSVHETNTFMWLTKVLDIPLDNKNIFKLQDMPKKVVYKKSKSEDGKEVYKEAMITQLSPIYDATVKLYTDRYEFLPNQVAWMLTRLVPYTGSEFVNYSSTHKEKFFMPVEKGTEVRFMVGGLKTAFSVAHPIAGKGDEQVIGDTSLIVQGAGGGFVSMVGGLLDSLLGF